MKWIDWWVDKFEQSTPLIDRLINGTRKFADRLVVVVGCCTA